MVEFANIEYSSYNDWQFSNWVNIRGKNER